MARASCRQLCRVKLVERRSCGTGFFAWRRQRIMRVGFTGQTEVRLPEIANRPHERSGRRDQRNNKRDLFERLLALGSVFLGLTFELQFVPVFFGFKPLIIGHGNPRQERWIEVFGEASCQIGLTPDRRSAVATSVPPIGTSRDWPVRQELVLYQHLTIFATILHGKSLQCAQSNVQIKEFGVHNRCRI